MAKTENATHHIGVIALAKDEREALEVVGPRLRDALTTLPWESTAIFVDGNSTDGSMEFLKRNGYHVITQDKPGIPAALSCGIREAKRLGCTILVMFQPDGNCDPALVGQMAELIAEDKADLVIGSRYMNGTKSADDSRTSAFGNSLFRLMFRLRFPRTSLRDPIVGYRAFKFELLSQLDLVGSNDYRRLEQILRATLSFDPLMTTRALAGGLRVFEVDAPEPARIGGKPKKTSLRWGICYSYQLWMDWLIWNARDGKRRRRTTHERY